MAKQKDPAIVIDKIYDLCVSIHAHAELDCEITLEGNGTNACEALNVARAIEKITGRKALQADVDEQVEELKKLYGIDGEGDEESD